MIMITPYFIKTKGYDVIGVNMFLRKYAKIFTSAEREVKVSRRSGMYQSYNFLTRLGMQSL